jgi:hypothetical protein
MAEKDQGLSRILEVHVTTPHTQVFQNASIGAENSFFNTVFGSRLESQSSVAGTVAAP